MDDMRNCAEAKEAIADLAGAMAADGVRGYSFCLADNRELMPNDFAKEIGVIYRKYRSGETEDVTAALLGGETV